MFKKAQVPAVSLYSGLSAVGVSMVITPYPLDLDGNKITMAALQSSPQLTIDPKISGYEEIIGFTTIIDNGDNTATLTGLSRDLASSSLATPGTGKQHGAGAIIVFSINPQDIARLAALENDEIITGDWKVSTPAGDTSIANRKYVDDVASFGAPLATTSVIGIIKLSAAPTDPAAPTAVGTNDVKVSPVSLATLTADRVAALAGTGTPNGTTGKYVTRDTLTSEEAAFEVLTNKDTTVTLGASDTKYPSQNAVKTYVDTQLLTAIRIIKNGVSTKNLADASTGQNIAHGLGVIPKYVRITAIFSSVTFSSGGVYINSNGVYNGITNSCIYFILDNTGNNSAFGQDTTNGVHLYNRYQNDIGQLGVITFDATNIIITWTKSASGSPTGTAQILWEAFA